jgi:hypothetical protein
VLLQSVHALLLLCCCACCSLLLQSVHVLLPSFALLMNMVGQRSLIAQALNKCREIKSADLTKLTNPLFKGRIPHPSICCNLSDRFIDYNLEEGFFTFMGRAVLTKLIDGIQQRRSSKISVLGTKHYGKSHMLAAYVAQRMQDCFAPTQADGRTTRPVIFIPKCSEFALSPNTDLQQAMMLSFATVEGALEEIVMLEGEDALIAWLERREFDVVVDQANDLEPAERLLRVPEASKARASELLVKLETICRAKNPPCFILRGFSANNQILKILESQENVDTKIMFYGGFIKVRPILS